MIDVAEFLLARFADDEAVANLARPDDRLTARDRSFLRVERAGGYAHVAATSGRILAECEAKRRIVALDICTACAVEYQPCDHRDATLRLLALSYADHPEWREEWRP